MEVSKWNERYMDTEFAYGKMPNVYLKKQLQYLSPGDALFPADGEGRNSVYAASLGWNAFSFDISQEGAKKAKLLASENNVTVSYHIGDLDTFPWKNHLFDALILIYAHFPTSIKSTYHLKLAELLKSGGRIIFEAFSKNHLPLVIENPGVGGPRDIGQLFSIEEIKSDFQNFEILELTELQIDLDEGKYHRGTGSVIRFSGIKK